MDLVQLNQLSWKVVDLNLAFLGLFNQLIFPEGSGWPRCWPGPGMAHKRAKS